MSQCLLNLWEAWGGAVRSNSVRTVSTTRLWRVFRRTSSHMSGGVSACCMFWGWSSRHDSSAVPFLSSMLCCCGCPLILPPCTVNRWVVGCNHMSWSWGWRGLNLNVVSCCIMAGPVSMCLKRARWRQIHDETHITTGNSDCRAGYCWQNYQNKEVRNSMSIFRSGPFASWGRILGRDVLDTLAPHCWKFKDLKVLNTAQHKIN